MAGNLVLALSKLENREIRYSGNYLGVKFFLVVKGCPGVFNGPRCKTSLILWTDMRPHIQKDIVR